MRWFRRRKKQPPERAPFPVDEVPWNPPMFGPVRLRSDDMIPQGMMYLVFPDHPLLEALRERETGVHVRQWWDENLVAD